MFNWKYRLYDIWKKRDDDISEITYESIDASQSIIRFKEGVSVMHIEVEPIFLQILEQLQTGKTLESAVGFLIEEDNDVIEHLTQENWNRFFNLLKQVSIDFS